MTARTTRRRFAASTNEVRHAKPVEPEPYECCGNGCQECVWEVYWRNLKVWEKLNSGDPAATGEGNTASPTPERLDPFAAMEARLKKRELE